jgi:2-C-methyl-D-erythritol 4-phosphate cytidylyltransferase
MQNTTNYVIIVAGGKGLRMGADCPKQFLVVGGKPILMHTLECFHRFDEEMHIILVLPKDHQAYWKELCEKYDFRVPYIIANGGETRFHSVRNGLAMVPDDAPEDAVVGVHDGVRPFVSAEVLTTCFTEARRCGAVVPVIPVVETVRRLLNEGASETVDRSSYRLVQTPQTFTVSLLKRAYNQPYTDAFTDDASVVEHMGIPVALVPGNRENIKITTPFDLKVAEILCK